MVVEIDIAAVDRAHVAAVRAFTRSYTRVIDVLQEGLLRSPYTLAEARVLFELAHRTPVEVSEVRGVLGLDGGYLSRMLARFEADGLLTRGRRPTTPGDRWWCSPTRAAASPGCWRTAPTSRCAGCSRGWTTPTRGG